MEGKIKVLIVDDSFFMRKLISDIINTDSEIEIVGKADSGYQAIELIKKLHPDIVTLDYQMPGIDGLATLKIIMRECPTKVLMLSAYTDKGADITFRCLHAGAVDFILKPSGEISFDIEEIKEELLAKIKTANQVDIDNIKVTLAARPRISLAKKILVKGKLVIIGASTGGPSELEAILPQFPQDMPASILIVQHIPTKFSSTFAKRLAKISAIEVKEAQNGDELKPGLALVAPGGKNIKLAREKGKVVVHLDKGTGIKKTDCQPSIDQAMESAAEIYGSKVIGVILTGMGKDGTCGMEKIKRANGKTLVQDEATSVVYGMPGSVVENGWADKIVRIDQMAEAIIDGLM